MIGAALFAYLAADTTIDSYVGGTVTRIFPLHIPQKIPGGEARFPCLVYDDTDVDRGRTYCATDRLVRRRVQIDSYATSYDEANDLAAAVRSALVDYRGAMGAVTVRDVAIETETTLEDLEPGLWRVYQVYRVWHEE